MKESNRTSCCFGLSTFDAVGTHVQAVRLECMKIQCSGTGAGSTEGKPPCGLMHVRSLVVSGKQMHGVADWGGSEYI
jgi:hypothetical protein